MARRGFTLLELLVTIAISGILTAMMFTDFSKEKYRNNLKAAVRQVQVELQGAQTKAQAGLLLSGFSVVPNGYGFLILNGTSYNLFANTLVCTGGGSIPCDDNTDCGAQTCSSGSVDMDLATRTLPGAGDITIAPVNQKIEFTKPNGRAVITNPSVPTATLYLKSTKLNICYAITVTANVGTVSSRQLSNIGLCP